MKRWFLRLWNNGKGVRYLEYLVDDEQLFHLIKHHYKMDVVNLETGSVCRHDYKKPLPGWANQLVTCQMVLASGQIPVVKS